mmetsp:Transcript_36659/g.82997  ORF Transcript_36659/g.82997 Transcript_36659/m.82997 type:complete len:325 (+) Transcript_36659:184-1158(+)
MVGACVGGGGVVGVLDVASGVEFCADRVELAADQVERLLQLLQAGQALAHPLLQLLHPLVGARQRGHHLGGRGRALQIRRDPFEHVQLLLGSRTVNLHLRRHRWQGRRDAAPVLHARYLDLFRLDPHRELGHHAVREALVVALHKLAVGELDAQHSRLLQVAVRRLREEGDGGAHHDRVQPVLLLQIRGDRLDHRARDVGPNAEDLVDGVAREVERVAARGGDVVRAAPHPEDDLLAKVATGVERRRLLPEESDERLGARLDPQCREGRDRRDRVDCALEQEHDLLRGVPLAEDDLLRGVRVGHQLVEDDAVEILVEVGDDGHA